MSGRWSQPMGYRQVLSVGLPLVVSMGSITVMQFTDRVFLSGYSLNAIAAALPAGIAQFLFVAFFMGTTSYVNVFVAQYIGSGAPGRVGAALWQGIWLSLVSWGLMALLYFAAPLFAYTGHPAAVVDMEMIYFRILVLGSGLIVLASTLGCFYSGRGLTRPVMVVNIIASFTNIPLDYALIFGLGPIPALGIAGAAIATISASLVNVLLYIPLIFSKDHQRAFGVRSSWRLEKELFSRLLRYGLPSGIQFFIDIFAITFFIFFVGRLGQVQLAATNIVLSIYHIAFMPMIGMSIAASTLVGQAMGGGLPAMARRAAGNTLHMAMAYMGLMALVMILFPEPLMGLFKTRGLSPAEYGPVIEVGTVLIWFIAFFAMIDSLAIIYIGALKGAGDIRFVMWLMAGVSFLCMILPIYLGVELWNLGVYFAWCCITTYVIVLGTCMGLRWRGAAWQRHQVVETAPKVSGE